MVARIRVPVAAEDAAAGLEAHPDYRVLRRMLPMRRAEVEGVRPDMLVGCAIDVETTGVDHDRDEVIELALCRFWANADGRIVLTGRPRSWLQEPGRPLSPEIVRLTGLDDAVLRGRSIVDAEAASLIRDADFVVAHNALFDRGFVEARLPGCAGRPWICSLADMDWRAAGFEGRRLGDLLGQMGHFFSAHRAGDDVMALLHLLDHPLDGSRTVLRALVDGASRPTYRIAAADTPFEARHALKARGYRWDAAARLWAIEVSEAARLEEIEWAAMNAYGGRREPDVERITWTTRYARRAAG